MVKPSAMSDAELKEALEKLTEENEKRKREKKELKQRKENYCLKTPEPKYEILYQKFYKEIMELSKKQNQITNIEIEKVKDICIRKLPVPETDIYPCPECGKMMLRAGNFGTNFNEQYKILCDNCGFVMPVRYRNYEVEAWEAFHEWLVKEGYLKKGRG